VLILWSGFDVSFKARLGAMVGEMEQPVTAADQNTTKNDLIRILHLREWPGAIAVWTRALGPMTRLELDANGSKVQEDEEQCV
jgi:hypothetical protein